MLEGFQKLFGLPQGNTLNFLVVVLAIWTVFWKGKALWKAARYSQKYWFIALLIVNTVGILEIIYISFFQKKVSSDKKAK